MTEFQREVEKELIRAQTLYPPMTNLHEGYAVILEELDEFWDEVRKKPHRRNPSQMYSELVQIAAMAERIAEDVVK